MAGESLSLEDEEFADLASRCTDVREMMEYFLFTQAAGLGYDNVFNNVYMWALWQGDHYVYHLSPWDMDMGFKMMFGSDEDTINLYLKQAWRMLDLDVNGAQKVLSVGTAIDYSDVDLYLDGDCTATVINGQFVMGRSERETSKHLSTVYSTEEFTGKVNLFNCAHWGKSRYTYNHNGTGEIFSALSHTDSNTDYIAFANVTRGKGTFVSALSTRSAMQFTGSADTQALKIVHGISTGAISVDKKIPDSVVTSRERVNIDRCAYRQGGR
jgi:hypothetical protein